MNWWYQEEYGDAHGTFECLAQKLYIELERLLGQCLTIIETL
jgi:hypothetical protein